MQDGLLIRAGNQLAFSHLSFQEFLTARDLYDPQGQRVQRALRSFLEGKEWWREALGFYVGMSTKPRVVEKWLADTIREVSPDGSTRELDARVDALKAMIVTYFPGYDFRYV